MTQLTQLQKQHFPQVKPLPGVERLLSDLASTSIQGEGASRIHMALVTSSHASNFRLKTAHLEELFRVFDERRRVLGDDERIPKGRGKPAPDIYLLALETVSATLAEGERAVTAEECLVFEDSVPGVEAGRRAGMRVVWYPHPDLKREYEGQEPLILAGRTGCGGTGDLHQLGEVDDGWADYVEILVDFPYEKYGVVLK